MTLNKSNGNMYAWITHTWNVIKGECPHGCEYCYMKRWGKQNPLRFDGHELKTNLGSGRFIFVGSSCDMWANIIPPQWIEDIVIHCSEYNNKYLFQSKNPGRFSEFAYLTFALDWVACTTIETNRWFSEVMGTTPYPEYRAEVMRDIKVPKYVTIEPIMDFDLDAMISLIKMCNPEQVNIGADSGKNNLPEPPFEKVQELIAELSKFTTIHKKRNLERLTK